MLDQNASNAVAVGPKAKSKEGIARPFEPCSNSFLKEGDHFQEEMARIEEDTSNALFDNLRDWEHQLKHVDRPNPQPRKRAAPRPRP